MRCKARSKRTGEQCRNKPEPGFEVCRFHGAAAAKKNLKHGKHSKLAMKTRAEFLEALGGPDSERARALVEKLHEIALNGNLEAIRYTLDQLYGSPKSTVVTEISDRETMAAVVQVTARYLTGQQFDLWLSELTQALESGSGSAT